MNKNKALELLYDKCFNELQLSKRQEKEMIETLKSSSNIMKSLELFKDYFNSKLIDGLKGYISCNDCIDAKTDYFKNRLSEFENYLVNLHLSFCESCHQIYDKDFINILEEEFSIIDYLKNKFQEFGIAYQNIFLEEQFAYHLDKSNDFKSKSNIIKFSDLKGFDTNNYNINLKINNYGNSIQIVVEKIEFTNGKKLDAEKYIVLEKVVRGVKTEVGIINANDMNPIFPVIKEIGEYNVCLNDELDKRILNIPLPAEIWYL